jgi:uncharacterized repeat protein (TIGR03803 family)
MANTFYSKKWTPKHSTGASMAAQLTTLFSFNFNNSASNGATPEADLFVDTNGDLFGTTGWGGANNDGTVFEIQNTGTVAAPVYAGAPTTLVSLNGSDGATPLAALTMDANGDLFGTTKEGGYWEDGTVFEIHRE